MSKKVSQETIQVNEVADEVVVDNRIPPRPARHSTGAVLASVANAEKPVRTSADEQRDPEFHARLARESQAQQAELDAVRAAEAEAYLSGDR